MTADEFIQSVLRNAEALRAAGVLKLQVDGCSVELSPHQPAAEPAAEPADEGEEHPAFNPKVRLRQYHRGDPA